MTLITVDAVVDVPRHVLVMEVGGVVAAVASSALEDGVIVGVRVARGANAICVAVSSRELRVLRVIESCTRPRRRVVTTLAGRGEKLRLSRVAGIGRVVVVGLMATDTGSGKRGVVVVDMAIRADARRHQVRTC